MIASIFTSNKEGVVKFVVENKPIRVAQIIGKWLGGGVESVVMNYYRNIDRSKIQFDFICDEDSTNIPYDLIEKNGGRVIIIPPTRASIPPPNHLPTICGILIGSSLAFTYIYSPNYN